MALDIANIAKEVTAASATVGTDVLQVSPASPDARVPYSRIMDGIALVGSAAAGDTIGDLFVNGRRVGTYRNSATGVAIDKERDIIPLDIFVPANALIEFKITDAPATNPILLQLEFHKPQRRATFRRSTRNYSRGGYGRGRAQTNVRSSGMY